MRKDLVEKIKRQLKSIFTQKFAEIKAGDMIISTPDEVLAVGSEVFMVDEDGMNVPLTDGEYILDSGEKIIVLGAKVTEISTVEEEMEVEAEVEVKEEEEVKEEKEVLEGDCPMKDRIEKMEVEMIELKKMITEMMGDKEVMKEEFSKIVSQPATKSISVKPIEMKVEGQGGIDIEAIRERARKKVNGGK
jgi:hypothetical protein